MSGDPVAPAAKILREVMPELTRTELRGAKVQGEIEMLLDVTYGRLNKATRDAKHDRGQPNTVGLSANQVGLKRRICVVDLSIGRRGYTDVFVLVNPRITWASASRQSHLEGCVNFDETWGMARRSARVKVAAWDRSGHDVTFDVSGWAAALMQHEVDHLNGRLFIDRLVDPAKAFHVPTDRYAAFRKDTPGWNEFVDVSGEVISDNDAKLSS